MSYSSVIRVATLKKDRVPSMDMYLLQDTAIYSFDQHFAVLVSVSTQQSAVVRSCRLKWMPSLVISLFGV